MSRFRRLYGKYRGFFLSTHHHKSWRHLVRRTKVQAVHRQKQVSSGMSDCTGPCGSQAVTIIPFAWHLHADKTDAETPQFYVYTNRLFNLLDGGSYLPPKLSLSMLSFDALPWLRTLTNNEITDNVIVLHACGTHSCIKIVHATVLSPV